MAAVVKPDARGLRVLLAGYGAFGAVHARAWADLGFADRLTIAEPDREGRARAAATLPRARVVADWRAALGDVDVVDIVTPSDTHLEIALAALDAGRDVMIEKPMTMSRAEATKIAAHSRATDRIVQVGYVLRTHPAARRLRDIVRSGEIGTPTWVAADFMCLKRPRRDAGVVLNDAVHVLDLVLWAIGRPPDEVSAMAADQLGRGVEDIVSIGLAWRDGPIGRVEASCIVAGEHADPYVPGGVARKRVSVTGDSGQVVADFMTDSLEFRRCRLRRTADGWWAPDVAPATTTSFAAMAPHENVAAELAGFVEAVTTRTQPDADVRSGVTMAAVCDAIFAAVRERRTIAVAA
ncbi:MAG TPA: Gfo/Idh/MocA family oxidoreductase [Vineibacter sp.]|nr:Gfo/Idh/MocA family oxidoreductase [Vineibacter sp.]